MSAWEWFFVGGIFCSIIGGVIWTIGELGIWTKNELEKIWKELDK